MSASSSDDDFFALPRPPERPLASQIIPPAELSEEITLAPVCGPSAAEIRQLQHPTEAEAFCDEAEDDQAEPTLQFSLREMMLITFVAAVAFAFLRIFPPSLFAGAMGAIAIVGLAILSLAKPEKTIFHLIWWTLLGVYIVASVIAVISNR